MSKFGSGERWWPRLWKARAHCIRILLDDYYSDARLVHLVMDNLNTHRGASLYETFKPPEAQRLLDRLKIQYTPKEGSWLNMAEIELSALSRQCLADRIDQMSIMQTRVANWEEARNKQQATGSSQRPTLESNSGHSCLQRLRALPEGQRTSLYVYHNGAFCV